MTRSISSILVCVVLMCLGCAHAPRGPYTVQAEAARNPLEAQKLTQQALVVIDRDAEKAERLLREALTADIFHGPAHNNLGVLLLQRGELYAAASEFEFARRLMPGHPDPRLNLALTLERAGRFDEAMDEYRSALEVYPGHIQSIQALTRCQLRYRPEDVQGDPEIGANLREIALRGETDEWRAWAARRLAGGGDAPHLP